METNLMFLSVYNEQTNLNNRSYERYSSVEEFFSKNIKSNYELEFGEAVKNDSGIVVSFCIFKTTTELPNKYEFWIEIKLEFDGSIRGEFFRSLDKLKKPELFFVFHALNEKELMRDIEVLNFLLKNY